jgi:hypothetical protein
VVAVGEDDVGGSTAPQQQPAAHDRIEVGCLPGQLNDGEQSCSVAYSRNRLQRCTFRLSQITTTGPPS